MKRRLICIGVLLTAFLIPLVCSPISSASSTLVYVDPEKNKARIGTQFTVDIRIADAVDVYSLELRLGWNPSVLNATGWEEGDFLNQGGIRNTFPGCKVYNNMGYLLFYNTLLAAPKGTNGSGTLCRITFTVKGVGKSTLDLYGVGLADSYALPITDFLVEDGRFNGKKVKIKHQA